MAILEEFLVVAKSFKVKSGSEKSIRNPQPTATGLEIRGSGQKLKNIHYFLKRATK